MRRFTTWPIIQTNAKQMIATGTVTMFSSGAKPHAEEAGLQHCGSVDVVVAVE